MENYEQKYKEALERARKYLYDTNKNMSTEFFEATERAFVEVFPELAESKDEKIRKAIINTLSEYGYLTKSTIKACDAIAWLEKQGEQKPIQTPQWMINFLDGYRRNIGCALNYEERKEVDGKILSIIEWLKGNHNIEQNPIEWGEEDEKIRNWITEVIETSLAIYHTPEYVDNAKNAIDWLEKQGEQKVPINDFKAEDWYVSKVDGKIRNLYHSVDMVEPKFKVGDWITDGQLTCKVLSVIGKSYELHLYNDDYCHFGTDAQSVDERYHLWTINDAKDGDVLHSIGWHDDCTFIFNGLDKWRFDEPNGDRAVATGYCSLSVSADKMEFGIQGPDCIEVDTVKPTIKIQRDLLFQKMKEAGYEWDADKKELKKIEQKPAWSEEDEKMFDEVINNLHNYIFKSDNTYFYIDCDKHITWLKSLKDRCASQL